MIGSERHSGIGFQGLGEIRVPEYIQRWFFHMLGYNVQDGEWTVSRGPQK